LGIVRTVRSKSRDTGRRITLAKGDYVRIGFNDTFGSLHWAPKRHIHDALPKIREACERAGKNWRNAA
jgi:hypothetical protein